MCVPLSGIYGGICPKKWRNPRIRVFRMRGGCSRGLYKAAYGRPGGCDPVFALPFGLIQRVVGALQALFQGERLLRPAPKDPLAHRHPAEPGIRAVVQPQVFDAPADRLCGLHQFCIRHAGEDKGEFLAPVPENRRRLRAGLPGQYPGDEADAVVPFLMPVYVVVPLEIVDVQHNHPDLPVKEEKLLPAGIEAPHPDSGGCAGRTGCR